MQNICKLISNVKVAGSEAYSRFFQTSMMEIFTKNSWRFYPLTIFARKPHHRDLTRCVAVCYWEILTRKELSDSEFLGNSEGSVPIDKKSSSTSLVVKDNSTKAPKFYDIFTVVICGSKLKVLLYQPNDALFTNCLLLLLNEIMFAWNLFAKKTSFVIIFCYASTNFLRLKND